MPGPSQQKGSTSAGTASAGTTSIADHYEVTSPMHASSTGTEIHLAKHRRTGELVVLKAIDRRPGGKSACTAAACYHARLEHEHICHLHEIFDSVRLVLVLEYVKGITLERFMLDCGCGPPEAQVIMHQLTAAVAHMHERGVCHRDLRLQNVMLREGERCSVKVIDLGLSGPADKTLTRRVAVMPLCAAPELLELLDAPPAVADGLSLIHI